MGYFVTVENGLDSKKLPKMESNFEFIFLKP